MSGIVAIVGRPNVGKSTLFNRLNESKEAFKIIMSGEANEKQIYDFLTLLSEKGEVSEEIAGGVFVLREKSKMEIMGWIEE